MASISFAILAVFAKINPYFPFDLKITLTIQKFNPGWFDSLMKFISLPGREPYMTILIGISIIILALSKLYWETVCALINALAILILGSSLKIIIQRQRPPQDLVHIFTHLHDWGFPSGHVLSYTTYFGFLMFLIYSLVPYSHFRTLLLAIFFFFIALVGISRVYLGEHWTSDTFGAYLIGTVLLLLIIKFYRWGKPKYFIKKDPKTVKI